jgi:hypothetical protein
MIQLPQSLPQLPADGRLGLANELRTIAPGKQHLIDRVTFSSDNAIFASTYGTQVQIWDFSRAKRIPKLQRDVATGARKPTDTH